MSDLQIVIFLSLHQKQFFGNHEINCGKLNIYYLSSEMIFKHRIMFCVAATILDYLKI